MRVANDAELEALHQTSLSILAETGMLVDHDEGLAMLADAGCRVDMESRRACFPPDLVESQIKSVPKEIVLGGRTPAYDVVLGRAGAAPAFRPAQGIEQVLDFRTGEARPSTLADLIEWTILADALPNIAFNATTSPADVHLQSRGVSATAVALRHTNKHVHTMAYSAASVDYLADLAAVIAGSAEEARRRPVVSFFQVSLSPLRISKSGVDRILAAGRHRLPIFLNSSPIMGATAPVTVAGCVALLNAEILAMNTILQLAYPGSPMVYTIRASAMDMTTMQSCWGMSEVSLATALSVELAKVKYGLITDAYGPSTESKLLDVQCATERASVMCLPLLARSDIIAGAGNIESQATMSWPQLVLDDELFTSMHALLRGVRVDTDHLAGAAISQVGPRGDFLTSDHTLAHFRTAFSRAGYFDRSPRATWESHGRPQVMDRVESKLAAILASHRVDRLSDEQAHRLDAIVKEARSTLTSFEG